MSQPEVVVVLDGRPRPAVVVDRDGEHTLVRFRDAGGFREEWVPTSSVVDVEGASERPNLLRLAVLAVVGVLGLTLLLYPGGSEKHLTDTSPTPTATPTPGTAKPVTAVMFGDAFVTGRALEPGKPTAVQLAARLLGWKATFLGGDGTAFTTGGTQGGQPYAQRIARELTAAPDVLVLQGGASDTGASATRLTAGAAAVVDTLRKRFPTTKLVMLGPVAMEQPPDGQLVRVDATLRAVASSRQIAYLSPIALRWITAANHRGYTASTGFYPNAAGHAYLGQQLADALRTLYRGL